MRSEEGLQSEDLSGQSLCYSLSMIPLLEHVTYLKLFVIYSSVESMIAMDPVQVVEIGYKSTFTVGKKWGGGYIRHFDMLVISKCVCKVY